jgi:acyl carrier protein
MISTDMLLEFFEEDLGVDIDGIEPETRIFSSGIIDSFALVTLMTFLEKAGGFRINPADVNLDNMDSIARIVDYSQRAAQ